MAEEKPSSSVKKGRPSKEFEECADRAKRYKASELKSKYPQQQLLMATNMQVDKNKSYINSTKALALMMDADLTKYQYETLKYGLQKEGYDILPPYSKVLEEKKKCYPDEIKVTEKDAHVSLQSLLDHTAQRLFKSIPDLDIAFMPESSLTLTSKWGCDGSSGHSEYNQPLPEGVNDNSLLLVSMVPLILFSSSGEEYWRNKSPSSTRYCRPISFEFTKETKDKVLEVYEDMKMKIHALKDTYIVIGNKEFFVKHNLLFTMLDGKTAQTLTATPSAAVCYICKAKPTEMNNLDKVLTKSGDSDACQLGISSLHARIKFMECILHIAYNMPFRKWSAKDPENKILKNENKKRIQKEFKEKMGLRVDFVQQGTGTSNDGNTSRRFFANPALVSLITGVSEELIERFRIILQIITCSQRIDSTKFNEYALDTAKLFVSIYSWYYMPVTVHKILIHGKQIIDAAVLPVGMLSEEARNKDYRKFRLSFSRKNSRISTNTDVLNRLLVTSDPFLTSLRKNPNKESFELDNIVKEMIIYE